MKLSMKHKSNVIEVFIAYRRGPHEGDAYVEELAKGLNETPLLVDGQKWGTIRVFFDRTTPASGDWSQYWGVQLKTARAFLLVCTAGTAKRRINREDILYKAIDWWLSHRRD